MKVVHLLLLICFTVLTLTVWKQGETITIQHNLIREMTKNHNCLVPEGNDEPKPERRGSKRTDEAITRASVLP